MAFAACADISTEKIEAMIRSGVTEDAALQRASRYFRHEKVINRGNAESKEASVCSIQADKACGSHDGAESELEEAENSILMKKRSTELWLSTQPAASFFDWMAGRGPRCPPVWSGGQALGAVFNQLVRSRAQLLLLE